MTFKPLKLLLVSTPIGALGSGKGGGVELTLISLTKGFLKMGHEVTLLAPEGSELPSECSGIKIRYVSGSDQPSWQHQDYSSPVVIPFDSILSNLWEDALDIGKEVDAILNFGYDWLPLWLTPHVEQKLFHLISMGGVSTVMQNQIMKISSTHHSRLAFHTHIQASDYELSQAPIVVGNGFDLDKYAFQPKTG